MVTQECSCDACMSGLYNPKDYYLTQYDFDRLNKKRPIGISGHLRVKNEAGTLEQCIESAIPFLDELLVIYQPSSDDTEEILHRLAQKYPRKLRLFLYEPFVVPQHEDTIYNTSASIHNLAHYYNYGYTKIQYRYYMKIDADQVYFTEKMLEIRRNLLRAYMLRYLVILYPLCIMIAFLLRRQVKYTLKIILANILRKQYGLVLGGLNIGMKNTMLCFPLFSSPPPLISCDSFSVAMDIKQKIYSFNGCVGDTLIWIPHGGICYDWNQEKRYEYIIPKLRRFLTGFVWCHFNPLKRAIPFDDMSDISCIPIEDICSLERQYVVERAIVGYATKPILESIILYWDTDKKYISQDFIQRYCMSIQRYFISSQ